MRKLFTVGIIFVLTMALFGCAQQPQQQRMNEQDANQEETEMTDVTNDMEKKKTSMFPREITTNQAEGKDVRWIMPGPRELDPTIFGTPGMPLGFEDDIGVPLDNRLTNEEGNAYTATKNPTPFSDKFEQIDGYFSVSVTDATRYDTPDSKDKAEAEFEFTDPKGEMNYRVVLKKLIPVGPAHPFMGGVLSDHYMHGKTSIGTRMMPTIYSYAAFWGVGELYINDEMVSGNRLVHFMATENSRNEDYELFMDNEMTRSGLVGHLMMPDTEVTPQGPAKSPVPTRFMLPNGNEQPFFHIMYEEPELTGFPLLP
jgi:hypothetical protein